MARRQTQGKHPVPPEQEAARNALAEEDAARLLERALANTDADSDADWDGLGYAFASQEVLAELWLTPEEDAAWQYLHEEM